MSPVPRRRQDPEAAPRKPNRPCFRSRRSGPIMEHVCDTSAIARIALAAARPWAYALGGARALVLHGIVDRPTTDIDLFGPDEDGGGDAAAAVARALTEAGCPTTEVEVESDLAGL